MSGGIIEEGQGIEQTRQPHIHSKINEPLTDFCDPIPKDYIVQQYLDTTEKDQMPITYDV